MKKTLSIIFSLIIILLSFTSCASSAKNDSYYSSGYSTSDLYTEVSYDSYGTTESVAASTTPDSADNSVNDLSERKIIKNANLSFQTKEYDDFMNSLNEAISSNGGYIERSDIYGGGITSSRYSRSADITVRVPADKYDSFINIVGTLGSLTNKSEYVSDVTLTYVDIESRINALETEYNALMELLAQANSVEAIIELRQRISEVQYQIESYKSQIRKYDDLISYCTVQINVDEVRYEVVNEEKQTFGERISTGLNETLYNIGESLQDFSVWFIVNLPYIIIWAVIIILAVIIIKAIVNSSKKRKEKKNAKAYIKMLSETKKDDSKKD